VTIHHGFYARRRPFSFGIANAHFRVRFPWAAGGNIADGIGVAVAINIFGLAMAHQKSRLVTV